MNSKSPEGPQDEKNASVSLRTNKLVSWKIKETFNNASIRFISKMQTKISGKKVVDGVAIPLLFREPGPSDQNEAKVFSIIIRVAAHVSRSIRPIRGCHVTAISPVSAENSTFPTPCV